MSTIGSQESPAQTSGREAIESSAGLRRLGRMAATESIARNLEHEDAAAERDARLNDAELYGEDAVAAAEPPAEDEMRIMAARDVHLHEPAPAAESGKRRGGKLMRAAIGAGLLATGIGGGAAIPLLLGALKPDPPAIQRPTDPQPDRYIDVKASTFPPKEK